MLTQTEADLLDYMLKSGAVTEEPSNRDVLAGLKRKGLVKRSTLFDGWGNNADEYEITSSGILELNFYDKAKARQHGIPDSKAGDGETGRGIV